MSSALRDLENETTRIILEAGQQFERPGVLWSMGKDSTSMLWAIRKAYFGEIPFPVIHIDTGYKFPEMYAFRDRIAREWGLDLRVYRNEAALADGMNPERGRLSCCTALKTDALKQAIAAERFDAVFAGIRGDEHAVRAKERVFSPRDAAFQWDYHNQPPQFWDLHEASVRDGGHVRVHPMLHWRETDIWEYVQIESVPVPDLYFARDGVRYRSIGCACCCRPVASAASTVTDVVLEIRRAEHGERAGRAQDKEDSVAMQKLRALGYM